MKSNGIIIKIIGALLVSLAFWLRFSNENVLWLWFMGILAIGLVLLTWSCECGKK